MDIQRVPGGGFRIGIGGEQAIGKGYDVTTSDRRRRSRTYSVGGADQHQDQRTLDRLRETSRDLDRNSCIIHGMIDRFVDNVVGPTFGFRAMTDSKDWNQAAHEWMVEKMGPETDVRGLFDFHEYLGLTLRALATDGDNFWLNVTGGQTQIIEAHQVGTPRDLRSSRNNVVNGVKMNANGRATAIFVGKESFDGLLPQSTSDEVTRISAENWIWPAYRTRYSQTRGVPMISAALSHFDLLDDYINNESLAAAIDACLAFFIQGDIDYDSLPDDQYTEEGADGTGTATTETLQQVQPGMIARLGKNEKVEQFGAKRPGTQFAPFLRASIRILGAEMGMPLELVLLDFSDGNFSSQRAAMLAAYRRFRIWQNWLVRNVATPQYRRWIGQAIAAGDLAPNDQAGRVKWFPPQWAWVKPEDEIKALKDAIQLGVKTQTEEINRNGMTLDEFVEIRREEIDRFQGNGTETPIPSTGMAGATVEGETNAYAINKQTTLPDLTPVETE